MESFYYNSPVGSLKITTQDGYVTQLDFLTKKVKATPPTTTFAKKVQKEMDEYFSGKRLEFTVPLKFEGTPFQEDVWKALSKVKYAETVSYKDIATRIRRPKATRAVGTACGRNPLGIFIPCHRIVGSNGGLCGFGGGLNAKKWLLKHETSK